MKPKKLEQIISQIGDKKAVINLNLDRIIKTISISYTYNYLQDVINPILDGAANHTKPVIKRDMNAKYSIGITFDIEDWLIQMATRTRNRKKVIKCVNTIGSHLDNSSYDMPSWFGEIYDKTRDIETVIKCANIISNYTDKLGTSNDLLNYELDSNITYWLAWIAIITKDKETVIECAKTISKYPGYMAYDIVSELGKVAIESKNKDKTIRALKMIKKIGRPLMDILDQQEIMKVINNNLDGFVTDLNGLYAVALYLKDGKRLEIPKPNKENIGSYIDEANKNIPKIYSINKKLNLSQILMLYMLEDKEISDVVDLVNNSNEERKREYKLDDLMKIDYSKFTEDEMKEYAVISVLGSRNQLTYKTALSVVSSVVGEKKVNKAYNSLHSEHKEIISDLIKTIKDKGYDAAISFLEGINNEHIRDVIDAANTKSFIASDTNKMLAVESKNPLDYNGNMQMACVYLPEAAKNGITEYCKDKNVILVRYDIGGKSLGSAICYKEGNRFLVDSVEGNRKFRKNKIFDKVYEDLIWRARKHGCNELVIGNNALNETPKKFISYVVSKMGLKLANTDFRLSTEAYIETKENKRNYIVELR